VDDHPQLVTATSPVSITMPDNLGGKYMQHNRQIKKLWACFVAGALFILTLTLVPTWGQDLPPKSGGDLNPDSGPTDATSQMYTLEDIYNRLDAGTEGQKQTTLTEPDAGPADGQGKTTDEIMPKTPVKDDTRGATPEDVRHGMKFWGLTDGKWGPQTGSKKGCGAYVAPNVWKEFDCYNLAAIGKVTGADPFTPSWELIGGYWQWGRKGPSPSNWFNNNTEHFAHGPTGPGDNEANSGSINWFTSSGASDGAWSDSEKTANDPCSAGYRVPTKVQWEGVLANNTIMRTEETTWFSSGTNYSNAIMIGETLILPVTGSRIHTNGALYSRGFFGHYWSSSETSSNGAWHMSFSSGIVGTYETTDNRWRGMSIRCVAE
jgi:uncharacterized protein (TIGR02145 family)